MDRNTRLRTMVLVSAVVIGFNAVATVTGFYDVVLDLLDTPAGSARDLASYIS